MGLFQKLFKRNQNTETIKVEVTETGADVAPVTTKTTPVKKPAAKTTTTTVTKQCAATTKAGTQCKRAPLGRGKFCGTHKTN